MGTLAAKTIENALAKARDVGVVEETFHIDDCSLVLRNLHPEEYVEIFKECEELEDVEYMTAYQLGHVSRALVEINGVDLRGVDFVEVEEPDAKTGQVKKVKLETHAYLRKHIFSTWSREALYTAYRKFNDVVAAAEAKAKEGVQFLLPEETPEDKYRNLIEDLSELSEDLPATLVDKILEEHGLMRRSTAEEIKAAMERTDALAREQVQTDDATPKVETRLTPEPERILTLGEVMAKRQPMNRQSAPLTTPAPMPTVPTPTVVSDVVVPEKTKEIAALEGEAFASIGSTPTPEYLPGLDGKMIPVAPRDTTEVADLRKAPKVNPAELGVIIDRPPVAGINPRFRPPKTRF